MVANKVLLKKPIVLTVGMCIEESDRFGHYKSVYYEIVEIDIELDRMVLKNMLENRTCHAQVSCHYSDGPSRWLNYVMLPNHPVRALYGKK